MKQILITILIMTSCFALAGEKMSNPSGKDKRKEMKKLKTEVQFITKTQSIADCVTVEDLKAFLLEQQKVIDALIKQTIKD